MSDSPSRLWEALNDEAFFKKEEVYSMLWNLGPVELSDFVIASARSGGPLALMRDPAKTVLLAKQTLAKSKITIFSSAGSLLQTINCDNAASKIVCFGFTRAESLVVLFQDGSYRIHPLTVASASSSTSLGYSQHSLGTEASETGVLEAKIYETGMVALLGSLSFVEVQGWPEAALEDAPEDHEPPASFGADPSTSKGKVVRLADVTITEAPHSWAVIPSEDSSSRQAEVLLGAKETVFLLDALDCQDSHLQRGPYTHIVPSPNGRFVALVTAAESEGGSKLLVVSADFSKNLSEYDLAQEGDSEVPSQVVWCGSNTVLLAWQGTVVMVGPFGDVLRYYYTDPVVLVNEVDGARIITLERCEFVQKVADSSINIFRPGSATPAAILYEATEQYDKKSPKADELIRNIRSDLICAVDTCIDAAGREFDVQWQRRLLKAASFGKTFLDLYNPSDFVSMTQTLRVLNAVRYYEIGMPLTVEQYRLQAPAHLVSRLTSRSQHLLSLRIASYLNLSPAPVLKHWASAKVIEARGAPDEDAEICDLIVDRLKGQVDVSCADVARTAWEKGQTGLATKLLDHEPRASKQVPLLLSMKEDNAALLKAIDSSDPDLVYSVLLHLKKAHGPANFFRFIDNKPDAIALFRKYAKENAVELLRDFNYQDDRRTESACLVLEESRSIHDFGDKMSKIREGGKFFSEDRDRSFEAKIVDEQLKLQAYQQTLEKDCDGRRHFSGLSINETIRQCIVAGWPKKADKVRTDWKVPDKRFWMVKMKALTEVRDWEGLETFARSKRSPVGYEPFVEHLTANGNHRQALSFVPRCEAKNRVEMYVKCGEWLRAGEECKERNDRNKLYDLRQRCPNNAIAAQLDQLAEEMGQSY